MAFKLFATRFAAPPTGSAKTRGITRTGALVVAVIVSGCLDPIPEDHAGRVESGLFSAARQNVGIKVDPPSTSCTLRSGDRVEQFKGDTVRVLRTKDSTARFECAAPGHQPVAITLSSRLEDVGGHVGAALGGPLSLLTRELRGDGRRFPPIVHIVLQPLRQDLDIEQWTKAKRTEIELSWNSHINRQIRLCDTRAGIMECDRERLATYRDIELALFDARAVTRSGTDVDTAR